MGYLIPVTPQAFVNRISAKISYQYQTHFIPTIYTFHYYNFLFKDLQKDHHNDLIHVLHDSESCPRPWSKHTARTQELVCTSKSCNHSFTNCLHEAFTNCLRKFQWKIWTKIDMTMCWYREDCLPGTPSCSPQLAPLLQKLVHVHQRCKPCAKVGMVSIYTKCAKRTMKHWVCFCPRFNPSKIWWIEEPNNRRGQHGRPCVWNLQQCRKQPQPPSLPSGSTNEEPLPIMFQERFCWICCIGGSGQVSDITNRPWWSTSTAASCTFSHPWKRPRWLRAPTPFGKAWCKSWKSISLKRLRTPRISAIKLCNLG